jgi:vancomycin aglycone glucosyltransferase
MGMRILLSTIGSRGDVQPIVALASRLKEFGHEVRVCVPPDFREWIQELGMPVVPIGPPVRPTGKTNPSAPPPTPEQRRQMIEATVAAQFETIAAAAQDCHSIVGATALQIAAPSIAEKMGIPYVFAAYSPAVLPSKHHAPPVLAMLGDKPAPMTDFKELWAHDAQRWNDLWMAALNTHRAALGLAPIDDVRGYVHTDQPWLAADATLAPWPEPTDRAVVQTGAWILPDSRPLSPAIERFLDAGEPPVYFGFGSSRATENLNRVMIAAARALGRRAIVSAGWADLSPVDAAGDCLAIGETNLEALFPRVAAAVHHGGAGTTTAAARGGVAQVIIPQHYDQHYWAHRIDQLGIGAAHAPGEPTVDSLTVAIDRALRREVADRARLVAGGVRGDGAMVAARRLTCGAGPIPITS